MAEKKSAAIPWLQQQESVEPETPKTSTFGDIFNNIGAWGRAAYADTMAIPMGREIKDVYDRLDQGRYDSDEEYNRLVSELDRLQEERNAYRNTFNENQKILNQNDSMLKDFTEIGGTVQGIGTQAKDTLIGAGVGALGGSVLPVAGTASGAMTGARVGNFVGSVHQAVQDADTNAVDAWEKVLQEGGSSEQAEQAYKDAFWNNMPTEALDIISSMYMGGKLVGSTGKILERALGGKLAGTLASGVNKVARFDIPAKIGTAVAKKTGKSWIGQGVGVGVSMLGNGLEEGIQEPWQDYATERAVDTQRRQYDPNHEGIRDFSVFGDGGLLDYYTTPEGRETAQKAAKMGMAFGGVGGLMSKSQFTELGTTHSDSIQAGKQQADWIEKNNILKDKGNLDRYNEVKETIGNIYGLTEDEKADLSVEDVSRMYHEYYANKYGIGGNRQEQGAVTQADFLNEITGEETARRGLMGDTATKYIDEFSLRPDSETLQGIHDNQQVLSEEQVQDTLEQNDEDAFNTEANNETINNDTGSYIEKRKEKNEGKEGKKGTGGLKPEYGNWKRVDEGEDYDYGAQSQYRNEKTGRVALVTKVNGGYTIQDVTNGEQRTATVAKTLKDVKGFLKSKANQKTAFQSDGTQEQVQQALPKEDGVISEVNSDKITEDAEKNQWYNGRKIQSNKAVTVHSMQDLHDYYKSHKDLMSADLYAEVSRQMMRFGIGDANNTAVVLDLTNREAGGFGSETVFRTDPNDPNSAIARAVVRLYAGADLATAAHEMAHLGWMNLSDQDRATFAKWAEKTQGEFVAKVLGMNYDQNFRSYLIEALTNRESETSKALWNRIKREGAIQQTLGILNGQDTELAVEERFAWEFSNWYAQGYIKGSKPRNIIERILNKACATLQGALNLLSDTNRYLNGEDGYNGGEINSIFTNMSTERIGQPRQTVAPQEQVELRTEMNQPIQEQPYNLGQGVDETYEENLYSNPTQNLGRNTGTVGAQTYTTPQVEQKPEQDLSRNTGNVPRMARTEGITRKPTKYTPSPTVDQRVEQMNRGLQNEYLDIDNSQTSPVYNNLAPSADEEYAMDVMKNADKTKGLEAMQKEEAAEREKAEKQARAEAEKQRKAREKEKRDKLNALNKDVKDKIATANKSLNAKKKQPSIEEMENQINEAENALVNFENEEYTLRMIDNPNEQISPQDKKTFNEYYHAIDDMRKRLNDIKQSQEQNKSVEKVDLTSDNQNATMVENQEGQEVADSGKTENTRGTEDLQGNVGEVQGRGSVRQGNDNRTGEGRIRQDAVEGRSEGNGKDISLLKDKEIYTTYNKRKEKKTELKDWRNMSGDDKLKQVYVDALNASKEADTQHGVYVDGQTVESLKDCKVILHKNKMAGFAITKDGNIVGVFSNPKNPIRGILNDMIFIAHMMGGNRMDCFCKFLLRGYRNCGFTPVARTTFAEEYYPADNPANTTIRKEKPDVFFLVKDNDNNNTYLNKVENDIYANDAIEAESVPLIDSEDSYSDALDFQGQVLKEIRKKSNANKSTKEVADSLRPKEETVTETQETPVQSSTVEQPVAAKSEPVVAKNETTENEKNNKEQVRKAMEQQMLLNREIDDIKGDHSDEKISYEEALNRFNEVEKKINSLQFPDSEQGRINNLLDNLKFARDIAESDNRRLHPEIEQAEKQKKIEEENKEYNGFLDNMSPMTRGKTIKQLSQKRNYGKDGGIMTKKAFIEKEVKNDSVFMQYITGDGYYLQYEDGTQRKIQQTDAEYYQHLSDQIREKEEAEKEQKRQEKRKDMPEDRWSKYRNKDGNIESDSEGVHHSNGDEIESPIFDIYDDPDSVSDAKDYIDALVSYDPSGTLLSNLKRKINDYQNTKNPVGEVEYWDDAIEAIEEEQENRRDNDGYVSADDNGSPWTSRMIMDNMKEHAEYLQKQNEEESEVEEQTNPKTKTTTEAKPKTTAPETQTSTEPTTETKQTIQVNKSDKKYQRAVELVLNNRGMSPVGLRLALEQEGINVGYVGAEKYLTQMEEDGLVEGAGEGSMRIPIDTTKANKKTKKGNNPDTHMQSSSGKVSDTKFMAEGEKAENSPLKGRIRELEDDYIRKMKQKGIPPRLVYKLSRVKSSKILDSKNPDVQKFIKAHDEVNEELWKNGQNIYRGLDGKWRHWVSDDSFDLTDNIIDLFRDRNKLFNAKLTLGDIFKHATLFKHYHELEGRAVRFANPNNDDYFKNYPIAEAYYESGKKEFVFNTNKIPLLDEDYYTSLPNPFNPKEERTKLSEEEKLNRLKEKFLPTALHEIQHSIQDIEEFANGGDPDSYLNYQNEIKQAAKDFNTPRMLAKFRRFLMKEKGFTKNKANEIIQTLRTKDNIFKAMQGIVKGKPQRLWTKPIKEFLIRQRYGSFVYERLLGEQEARDTMERYKNEERQKEVPMLSESTYKDLNSGDRTIIRQDKRRANNDNSTVFNRTDGRGQEANRVVDEKRDSQTDTKEEKTQKKTSDTRFQEAGQAAENQTLLTPQKELELENLFWKLIRKKEFHGMDKRWNSGSLTYYKSLYNRMSGKDFNPEYIMEDKAFLTAIKNVNDYINKNYKEYKNLYRGVDGHWRFEFSDKDAHFLNGFEKLSGKTLDTTLEKILKHDNLYKFYSKLKEMPVHLIRNEEMQRQMEDTKNNYYAMYDPETKSIYINSDMFEKDDVRNSLLHEIQHAIQDIEGFANGTNDNAYNNNYDFSEGEKQAVLTEKRSNMSDEELQNNPRYKTLNPEEKTIMSEQRPVKKVAKSPNTKMQSNGQTNLGYIDKQKDIYSVTFTKSAQKNGENQKKIAFYRNNKSYWRENKDAQTGSITFTRALPYRQHQKTIIYDDINGKTVGKKKKTKVREYIEAAKDQIIKWLFNDKHFLKKAARNVGAIESYMRMMVMKDQGAVAGAAIEDGIVKHNGKNGERTKSLNSIIEAVGEENQTEFLKYCEAYRVLDLEKRNIYQKMTPKDARDEIAKVQRSKNAKLFEEQRKNFVEYNHELLWVLVDGGFITEKQYDKFIQNDPNFIPLSKNMDELEGYVDGFRDSKTMINVQHPMHKIGTSMGEVANPFLEMQKRTIEYYVKASRNKAGLIFVHDIAEAIAQTAGGNVVAQNQGMIRKLASRDKNGKPISHDNKQYVFYVWENGQKQYYQVADREIYVALKSFDAEQMGALSKIANQTAGLASRLVRNTATMTPDFGLRNLVRDNVEAFISSEHGFLPLVDSLWGMYQMANDTQWFREYQALNGEHLSLNRDGENVATVEHNIKDNVKFYKNWVPLFKKDLHEFTDSKRSVPARLKSLLKLVLFDIFPLQALYKGNKRLNDYLETGTRIGEYRNARMGYRGLYGRLFKGKGNTIFTNDADLKMAQMDKMFAAYKAKDITLNFGQHGRLGKEVNKYIPFFNASLQGIYKVCNTLESMVRADDARLRQELWFKFVLMGAMGMAAAMAGQGDDDYDEAPDYEHDNFWILPNGIRIPKDQLFGRLVGGTVEKATRQYLKDGDVKKKELLFDILGNFAIDKCIPAIVDLAMGLYGDEGYDSFRKKPVVPSYMVDWFGYQKKDLSTSKLAADISEGLLNVFGVDVAAKKIDFVFSKTLSNLGNYTKGLYDLGTNPNERMTRGAEPEDKGGFAEWSKELPYPMNTIVGTFATNRNTFQSVSDFYNRYKELKKFEHAPERMSKAEKRVWEAYKKAYKDDKKYRDALKAIKIDKSLTGAQKRERADKIFKQQIRMARKLRDYEKKQGLI